jgi:hypothetical protein
MLPDRFVNHLKNRNWGTLGLELLVVVSGVFLGLQVDNWNQARIQHNEVKSYYDRLIEDLRANERDLVARQDYYQQVHSHGQAALATLRETREGLTGKFLVDAYQATQIWQFVFNRSTFDEILSTGAMDTIPDLVARRRISNYYVIAGSVANLLRDENAYREAVRSHLPVDVQRRIEENCGDVVTTTASGAVGNSLATDCSLVLDDAEVATAIDSLLSAPDLETRLNLRLSNVEAKLRVMQRNIERSRELADFLAKTRP